MRQTLEHFFKALRSAGLEISVSESLDAVHAVQLVGLFDRGVLKNALSASLAKSRFDEERFDDCFERFFSLEGFMDESETVQRTSAEADEDQSELAAALLDNDREKLLWMMQRAAGRAGITNIWFFTQKGVYINRILKEMGIDELNAEMAGAAGGGGSSGGSQAGALTQAADQLREEVRDYVEKQLALYGEAETTQMIEEYLKGLKLSNIEERDFRYMHEIVRKLAKRLSAIHSRKRKLENRGVLDFRRTLRKNLAYDGLLFETHWKKKTADRPRVVAICDVSRSVRAYSRFLLLFLYSLNDVIADIKSFAFVNRFIEITDVFDEYPVEQAIDKIQADIGFGVTDYGQVFMDIKKDHLEDWDNKTTVIILGDARNNNGDPRTHILKELYRRCKRILWMNPEPRPFWGTGDSEMRIYAPYCNVVKECNTISHLEMMVNNLLRAAAQNA